MNILLDPGSQEKLAAGHLGKAVCISDAVVPPLVVIFNTLLSLCGAACLHADRLGRIGPPPTAVSFALAVCDTLSRCGHSEATPASSGGKREYAE